MSDAVGVQGATYAAWGLQFSFVSAAGATVELIDGGASGTSKWKQVITVETAGLGFVNVNLHGLEFLTDIYIVLTNDVTTSIQYS
jgi:hypothetical protein